MEIASPRPREPGVRVRVARDGDHQTGTTRHEHAVLLENGRQD